MNLAKAAFILWIILTPPQPGVEIELILYHPDGTVWIERLAGRCVTDAQGACQMRGNGQSWQDGLLRGELRWAGGKRALLWPGGGLEIELTSQIASEARYDYLAGDATTAPQVTRRGISWIALLLAGGILAASGWLAWKGRRG